MGRISMAKKREYHKVSYLSKEDYRIYVSPAIIKKYLEGLIEIQNKEKSKYFPCQESQIEEYFTKLKKKNIDIDKLKHSKRNNLELISEIISYYGQSGLSFLENVSNVVKINKPVLLFYGIEQLAAYFLNLYFNFTEENTYTQAFEMGTHGIRSFEFQDINSDNLANLLNLKIKLDLKGLAPRFFLIYKSMFNQEIYQYFIEKKQISFLELLKNFFGYYENRLNLSKIIKGKFIEFFDPEKNFVVDYPPLFTIYLTSFLFAHLSRYKMNIWAKLLSTNKKNLSFFITFFLNHAKGYFKRILFQRLVKNEAKITGIPYYPSRFRITSNDDNKFKDI